MVIGILGLLAAVAIVAIALVVAVGAIVGASLGLAFGGVWPWLRRRSVVEKGQSLGITGQILRSTLGMLCGGALGGLAGTAVAVLLILALAYLK
jgi:hypothetical protein